MKSFSFYFFLTFLLFIKSEAEANKNLIKELNLFQNNLIILSEHSYSKNGLINWSDEFIFIKKNKNILEYRLENQSYKITRIIEIENSKINLTDKYTNKLNETIGIISNYNFKTLNENKFLLSGMEIDKKDESYDIFGENPSIILQSKNVSFGFFLKDQYSKIHTKLIKKNNNELILKNNNLIIKPKQSYTKNFEIIFFNKELKYYEYVNFLRNEFNNYSIIDGNLFFLDTYLNREIFKSKKKLKSFINNYNVKFIITTPWIDYDDFNFLKNKRYTRNEIKEHFQEIKKIIKSIDPDVKLLAAIQSNIVSLNYEAQDIIKNLNKISGGFHHYEINPSELIKTSKLNINESELIFDKDNKILFETFFHDRVYENKQNIVEIALPLKAYKNGHLFKKLKNQIDFVIDEIGYDGIYIDQLNQYFISPKHRTSFNEKNNNIAEIDIYSGKVKKEYEDVTLNTHGFKNDVIEYALTKTNYIIANTHHLNDELRKKPIIRFAEGFWYFWAAKMWKENSREFFAAKTFFRSHLSTPVALSLGTFQQGDWNTNPHNALVKNLRFCLFNGNLMYFLEQDINKLNLNSNKLNIFQKIYPIKIEKINEGTVYGKNKIITIKSLKMNNEELKKYNIFIFDKSGYIIENANRRFEFQAKFTKIKINEKEEILILEKK